MSVAVLNPATALAVQIGGRLSHETVEFLDSLAWSRCRGAPMLTRASVHLAWRRRWTRLLAIVAAGAWAESVAAPSGADLAVPTDGVVPPAEDILADAGRR